MTPEQCALIATLSYCEEFHSMPSAGTTVKGIIEDNRAALLADPAARPPGLTQEQWEHRKIPTGYTREQWGSLLDAVCDDPALGALEIRDVSENPVDKGAMITLVDSSAREAVIVFQGTCSKEGWKEDFLGGAVELTESQREAIRYADEWGERLMREGCSVTATGHSKGGNEAALVAVESEHIGRAFAFDAPGNSKKYFDCPEHAARAERRGGRVAYYNHRDDYVSAVLIPYAAATTHWIESDFDEWSGVEGLKGIMAFSPYAHATTALFNSDQLAGAGGFRYADGPGPHAAELRSFSVFLMERLPERDCRHVLGYLGTLVGSLTDHDLGEAALTLLLDAEGLGILLATLDEYPRAVELLDCVLDDEGWADDLASGVKRGDYLGIFSQLLVAGAGLCLAVGVLSLAHPQLRRVERHRALARLRLRSASVRRSVARVQGGLATGLRVRDFSDARLAELEAIQRLIAGIALPNPLLWGQQFAHRSFYRRLSLAPEQRRLNQSVRQLDGETCEDVSRIRRGFEHAWALDGRQARRVSRGHASMARATAILGSHSQGPS